VTGGREEGGRAIEGAVLPSPVGGMGGLVKGFGVAEGRGAGLYSVVWLVIATGAETSHSFSSHLFQPS